MTAESRCSHCSRSYQSGETWWISGSGEEHCPDHIPKDERGIFREPCVRCVAAGHPGAGGRAEAETCRLTYVTVGTI